MDGIYLSGLRLSQFKHFRGNAVGEELLLGHVEEMVPLALRGASTYWMEAMVRKPDLFVC